MIEESEIVNHERYKTSRELRSQNTSLDWSKRNVPMAAFAFKYLSIAKC